MKNVNTLRSLLLVFTLAGCASTQQISVSYNSDPQGATLYEGSVMLGYTPYTAHYNLNDEMKKTGGLKPKPMSVKWASGATAAVSNLYVDLNKYGLNQSFTFQRPDNYPGRQIDVQFALKVEELRLLRRNADAQESAVLMQMINANKPQNCTSTKIGNQVSTTCY